MRSPRFPRCIADPPRLGVRRLRAVVLLLALGTLPACATWAPVDGPARLIIEERQPRSVRVITPQGDTTVIRSPRLEGDSIATLTQECRRNVAAGGVTTCEQTSTPVVALADVQSLELRKGRPVRTALLLVGGFVVASYAYLLWAFRHYD